MSAQTNAFAALFLFITALTSHVHADEPKKGNVLDFDADVIQGERRKPEIFIQVAKEKTNLESVIYGRQDFNDFHRVDRVWRPEVYELPQKNSPNQERRK